MVGGFFEKIDEDGVRLLSVGTTKDSLLHLLGELHVSLVNGHD